MTRGLVIHALAYGVTCGLLVAVWLLTGGSVDSLRRVADDPTVSVEESFWPVWVILSWGAVLVFHAAVSLVLLPRRVRERRRARRRARASRRHHADGRQWVTVMFTDIVGSTRLNEELGDEAWHRLLTRHRRLVRDAVAVRAGTEVATAGDGFLVRFASPVDAARCGVDIQRAVASQRRSDPSVPEVRVGIHTGEALADDGDVVGRVVNLASRVAAAAAPGEVLVTEPVADQVGGVLVLEDRGLRELRGISQPRHLLAVDWAASAVR